MENHTPFIKREKDLHLGPYNPAGPVRCQLPETTHEYNNICWSSSDRAWVGSYVTSTGRVLSVKTRISALMAAKLLNTKCRNEGCLCPNPLVGCLSNDDRLSSMDIYRTDLHPLLYPLDFGSKQESLESLELPPPVFHDDNLKSLDNKLMLN